MDNKVLMLKNKDFARMLLYEQFVFYVLYGQMSLERHSMDGKV
jgi:hypothetical protein